MKKIKLLKLILQAVCKHENTKQIVGGTLWRKSVYKCLDCEKTFTPEESNNEGGTTTGTATYYGSQIKNL